MSLAGTAFFLFDFFFFNWMESDVVSKVKNKIKSVGPSVGPSSSRPIFFFVEIVLVEGSSALSHLH